MATKITKQQAEAFLESLWPCGEMCHLANHTRSFLSGVVGRVPNRLRTSDWSADDVRDSKALADALRGIADHIEQGFYGKDHPHG